MLHILHLEVSDAFQVISECGSFPLFHIALYLFLARCFSVYLIFLWDFCFDKKFKLP